MTILTRTCLCGDQMREATEESPQSAWVCATREHVVIEDNVSHERRVYIHVENPADVIDTKAHCWLCGGADPNETVTVAREHPNGPKCPAYRTKVHTGCWQDMAP